MYFRYKNTNLLYRQKLILFFNPNTTKNKILNTIKNKRLTKIFPKIQLFTLNTNCQSSQYQLIKIVCLAMRKGCLLPASFDPNEINSETILKEEKNLKEVFFNTLLRDIYHLNDIGMRIHGGITRRNPQEFKIILKNMELKNLLSL